MSKATVWHSTQQDILYSYNFKYDALNRVTGITISRRSVIRKNELINQETRKFFYSGNEQQPYKSIGFYRDDPSAEIYYFYDNNGRVITDSIDATRVSAYTLNKYDWSNDWVLSKTITKYENGIGFTEDSNAISNNNITGTYIRANAIVQGTWGNTNVYDDKTNPLNTLNIRSVFAVDGMSGLFSPGYSKNNITRKITEDRNSAIFGQVDITNYKYQYNTAGLPVECEIDAPKWKSEINYYYSK